MKLRTISTRDMSREEWRELRRKGIGGSDAAAILGLNPYATPYTVWADKTGRLPDKEETEAMRQGRDLEGYVADRWMEATGRKVHRRNAILINPAYPWALANIDRWVVGANEGLECKTTSVMSLKRFKDGEYPVNYYVQCVHYLAVTGADRWHLGVLVLNQGFYHFVIERDEDEIKALMESEKAFWEYVEKGKEPPLSGMEPDSEALSVIYAESREGMPIDLFGRDSMIEEYIKVGEIIKEYEQQQEMLKQNIQLDMGENERGMTDKYLVLWQKRSRSTFDYKKYAADNPGLDLNPYFKISSSRYFSIKAQ